MIFCLQCPPLQTKRKSRLMKITQYARQPSPLSPTFHGRLTNRQREIYNETYQTLKLKQEIDRWQKWVEVTSHRSKEYFNLERNTKISVPRSQSFMTKYSFMYSSCMYESLIISMWEAVSRFRSSKSCLDAWLYPHVSYPSSLTSDGWKSKGWLTLPSLD